MLAGRRYSALLMMETEFSKRVYQGVRVKHTVKDLLAEKRSRQSNGPRYNAGSNTPPSFVQMSGSHMLPGYYGMRRSFISDPDFCSPSKQFSPDMYASALTGKALGCEASAVSTYSSLIDSYYPESFSDYRGPASFSTSGGSFLPSAAFSSLLPPFSGESAHLFLRDSWESVPEPASQVDVLCPDSLAPVSVPPSMSSPEPAGSPSQYRPPSQAASMATPMSSMSSSHTYSLHSLDDVHFHPLSTSSSYPLPPTTSSPSSSSAFSCPSYLSSSVTDLVSKMVSEDTADNHSSLSTVADTHQTWVKEDGVTSWAPYDIRRAH